MCPKYYFARRGNRKLFQCEKMKMLFWLLLLVQILVLSVPSQAATNEVNQIVDMSIDRGGFSDEVLTSIWDLNLTLDGQIFHYAYDNKQDVYYFTDKEIPEDLVKIEIDRSGSILLVERQNLPPPLAKKTLIERQGFISATFAPVPCRERIIWLV